MTIAALITGSIHKAVAEKQARSSGEPYVDFTIATKTEATGTKSFVRATVFDKATIADAMTLSEGDAVTVRGRLKAEVWEGKVSLSIVAAKILPLVPTDRRGDGPPKQQREAVQLGDALPAWIKGAVR